MTSIRRQIRVLLPGLLIGLLSLSAGLCHAQESENPTGVDTLSSELNVYLDCRACDEEFFQTEITFANFVRDRGFANVHILVTSLRTGSGGRKYSLEFIGKDAFDAMGDTLTHVTIESITDDELRNGLANIVKAGLVRYLARTPAIKDVDISHTGSVISTSVVDKWNNWVFEIDMNSFLSGQETSRSINIWTNIEARRVTEDSKIGFEVWGSYNEDRFDLDDTTRILSISRNRGAEFRYVAGLSDRWSVGMEINAFTSSYNNQDLAAGVTTGIEYSLYPYSESTQRRIKLEYRVSAKYADYEEETIFDKSTEWLYRAELTAKMEFIRPWGSMDASLSGSHYFHDLGANRLRLRGRLKLRVTQGLSFNINGSYSRIRDQLSLRKGDVSDDEVLLRRRELATGYNYWTSFGISYSFGSRYSDAVNTRFD